MAIRNQDFYDLNESRPWPLSDEATGYDDTGALLPSRLIADLHLAFPSLAGPRAMIGAVTVTKTLVTVTFLATESPASPATFTPIAAVSLVKPIDPHRQYPLDSLFPGTGGWIVFGSAATETNETSEEYTGRFTNPSQSILLPSTARSYLELPISGIAKVDNITELTGLVKLFGGNDIEIVKECREIPNNSPIAGKSACDPDVATVREVIVIRLASEPDTANLVTTQRNVFDEYKGPCGGRPESDSCGDPFPIELLASVPPDCCGNIDIRLRGCAALSEVTENAVVDPDTGVVLSVAETCGVIIDCGLGLADACVTPDRLPAADGKLPNEYNDLCVSETSISITLPPDELTSEVSFTIIPDSESAAVDPTLPFCDDFSVVNADFIVEAGDWAYGGGTSWGTETAGGPVLRNVSLWDFEFDTFYKRVAARVQMRTGSPGQRHNAAVISNYQETSPGSGRFSYYLVELDWDSSTNSEGFKLFRIAFFDGTTFNTVFAVPIPTLRLEDIYEICLTVFAHVDDSDAAWLYAQVTGITDPSINVTIGPVSRNNYIPSTGKFGMATNRAATRFLEFCVENTTDTPTIGCSSEPPPFL